ncbi:MAG: TolC family protein, partial [Vampirovibrionia bacterium]
MVVLLHSYCYSSTNSNQLEIFDSLDSEETSVVDIKGQNVVGQPANSQQQSPKSVNQFNKDSTKPISVKKPDTSQSASKQQVIQSRSNYDDLDKPANSTNNTLKPQSVQKFSKDTSEPPVKKVSEPVYSSNKSIRSDYDNLDQSANAENTVDKEFVEEIEKPEVFNAKFHGISDKVETIDLPTSIGIALAKNIDIKISTLRNDQEKWKYVQAWTGMLPNVTLGYNFARYQGTQLVGGVILVSVIRSSVVPSLIADATVFSGFKNLFNAIAEKHQYRASINTLEANLDEIIYNVTEGYYKLLQQKATCVVDEKTLEESHEQLKLNQERYYAGVGTKLDVLQSQSLVSQAEQQLIQSQNSLKLAMVSFANLIGIDLYDQLLPVEDTLEMQKLIPADITLQDMVDVALLSRSEVERDRHLIRSLVLQRRAAFSNYWPHASLSGGLQGSGDKISNVRRSQYISVNLQWRGLEKLGTSGILQSKEIGAQVKEARLNLYNTMRDIQEDVIGAYYSRETSEKLLESSKVKVEA